jgi:hypothetical protein
MENCEAIEDCDTTSTTVAHQPNNSKSGTNKGAKPSDPKKQKWCENHGWSNHTTAECNQKQPGFDGFKKGNNKPKGKAFGNKTNAKSWQRKNDEATKEVEKKEMNAVVKKQIHQTIRKEVNAFSKKKSDDLNMMDVVLQNFNYADMDNMNIESDREVDKDLEIDWDNKVSI